MSSYRRTRGKAGGADNSYDSMMKRWRNKVEGEVRGGMREFILSLMPSLNMLMVIVLVVSAVYLSGAIVTPVNCGTTDINTCAMFPKNPEVAKSEYTLTWTITGIVVASMWILIRMPFIEKMFLSTTGSTNSLYMILALLAFVLIILLLVVGGVAMQHWLDKRDNDVYDDETANEDNGGSALLLGGLAAIVLLSVIIMT